MAITIRAPQASKALVPVPKVISDADMETARECLRPKDFKVLTELIGRKQMADIGPRPKGYSEESILKRIRSYVRTAQIMKAKREDSDLDNIEEIVSEMARV